MKYEESKKITALGVVIFSFIALLLCFALLAAFDAITALIVLKTSAPESLLKVGNVLGSGVGLIVSTAFLTIKAKMKGILSAGIMGGAVIVIKILGNLALEMGGYFTWNGVIGIVFTLVFVLVGGALGGVMRKR